MTPITPDVLLFQRLEQELADWQAKTRDLNALGAKLTQTYGSEDTSRVESVLGDINDKLQDVSKRYGVITAARCVVGLCFVLLMSFQSNTFAPNI